MKFNRIKGFLKHSKKSSPPMIKFGLPTVLVLIIMCFSTFSWSQRTVFDESGLLTDDEKAQVEAAMASLTLSHIHLADDFEGLRPNDFAYNTFKEVFYNRIPIGKEGFVIVYNISTHAFAIYNGTKWTHIIENEEKQFIINELLKPAFERGEYATGLLNALARIEELFKENNTFPMSDEVLDKELLLVDESSLLAESLPKEIEEYLKDKQVTSDEHIIYIRISNFKGEDFDPHYSPYHSEGTSDLDDINYVYARQIYNALFKDRHNRFQVGSREPPDLTLICIFEDELYLLSNWEEFLEVQLSEGGHVRTLTDYLDFMYGDYIGVGRETAGIKRVVKLVVELSRKEIEPQSSEFKPPFFSLAWFNSPLRFGIAIFGGVILILAVLIIFIALRKRSS